MGIFGKGKSGGVMNVIRCDEPEYLVWKWRPEGQSVNSTSRENSIRYGSSLRVKDGEVAVFVYRQPNGTMQDFIYGPYDETIKTANFPVLAGIVGAAFGGNSPFQAEIYFINLSGVIKMPFAVPFFDVADPRFLDYVVPMAAGGSVTFNVQDPERFIKTHRMIDFSIDALRAQVKDAVVRRVKNVIANAPSDYGMPLVQLERKIDEINDILKPKLTEDFADFGVNLTRLDLSRIEPDKESEGWEQLRHVTVGQQTRTIDAQTDINIQNLTDTQRINAQNMADTLKIQREEAQRAQRLQTETQFIGAHALDRQADVMQTAASNLGQMGNTGGGASNDGGMNPAGMMTGMMMGGALGGQMANMINQMGNAMNGQFGQQMAGATPPPPQPQSRQYHLSVNGQQQGPFTIDQLRQFASVGQFTPQTYVWTAGMSAWAYAATVPEIAALFSSATPPPPPPPMP